VLKFQCSVNLSWEQGVVAKITFNGL